MGRDLVHWEYKMNMLLAGALAVIGLVLVVILQCLFNENPTYNSVTAGRVTITRTPAAGTDGTNRDYVERRIGTIDRDVRSALLG
jgi:hypothetical protein